MSSIVTKEIINYHKAISINYHKAISILASLNTWDDFNSVTPEEYELVNYVYDYKTLDDIESIYEKLETQYPEEDRVDSEKYMNLYRILDTINCGEFFYGY